MANEVNIYTPRHLAEVVRQAPSTYTFFRDKFFSRTKTYPTEAVDIDLVKGDRRMAAFVHPLAGGQIIKGTGYETKSYKPPLINPYDVTTADQLLHRLPGEDMYSGMTPADRAAVKLIEEYKKLDDATARREEWMAVQAIVEGSIVVKGKGVNDKIDFGLTNKVNLSADAWDQTKADPLKNLKEWKKKISQNGFANADMVILGEKAEDLLMSNEKILSLLDNRRVVLGEINPKDLPNGVRYIGHLNSPNVDLYAYDEVYLDDWTNPEEPVTKPLIEPNLAIMIPSSPKFLMTYGLCTYIDDRTQAWTSAQTNRLLRSYIAHAPDRRMLELQAHPLPIPDKVDSWLVAKVCT